MVPLVWLVQLVFKVRQDWALRDRLVHRVQRVRLVRQA
jgi:hypothetical protein